jgi:hypothetical protein
MPQIVEQIFQCVTCEREFVDKGEAIECCHLVREYFKCTACGENVGGVLTASIHNKFFAENGFCRAEELGK